MTVDCWNWKCHPKPTNRSSGCPVDSSRLSRRNRGSTSPPLAARPGGAPRSRGGLEADESYYIQNYARIQGREVDLTIDPPPDLAIEIDLSLPDVEKSSIYARLGVPEIWRWRDGRLTVFTRHADGNYIERATSLALADFPLRELAAALAGYPETDPAKAVAQFRKRVREKFRQG